MIGISSFNNNSEKMVVLLLSNSVNSCSDKKRRSCTLSFHTETTKPRPSSRLLPCNASNSKRRDTRSESPHQRCVTPTVTWGSTRCSGQRSPTGAWSGPQRRRLRRLRRWRQQCRRGAAAAAQAALDAAHGFSLANAVSAWFRWAPGTCISVAAVTVMLSLSLSRDIWCVLWRLFAVFAWVACEFVLPAVID